MKVLKVISTCLCLFSIFSVCASNAAAQEEIEKINLDPNKQIIKGNHQIPSPKTQRTMLPAQAPINGAAIVYAEPLAVNRPENHALDASGAQTATVVRNDESAAEKLAAHARRESLKARLAAKPLTEIYRVGIGDILDVRLLNSPDKNSTLFTVLEGGVIDYPLAGEPIPVAGLTTEEIAETLSQKIKLYEAPEVTVGVRDYASHKIFVGGAVEKPGVKLIRREAVPLFTILAEAIQFPNATHAEITRRNKEALKISLTNLPTDVLVSDGDLIKILAENQSEKLARDFYFIAGLVASPGQKEFHQGITVTQAILAAGGSLKANKVLVLRQNSEGFLISSEMDLKQIKNGKMQDLMIQSGDRIEIK